MWQVKECSNCQNEVFAKPDEVDVFCGKCEELVSLRIKVEELKEELIDAYQEGLHGYPMSGKREWVLNRIKELKS